MSFRADPDELHTMAIHLNRCREYLDAAISYFDSHVGSIGATGTGILSPLSLEHPAATDRARKTFDHLRTILDKSSAEFERMAGAYRSADRSSAARLDATYADPARVYPGKERY